jgi:hypothetical protein
VFFLNKKNVFLNANNAIVNNNNNNNNNAFDSNVQNSFVAKNTAAAASISNDVTVDNTVPNNNDVFNAENEFQNNAMQGLFRGRGRGYNRGRSFYRGRGRVENFNNSNNKTWVREVDMQNPLVTNR